MRLKAIALIAGALALVGLLAAACGDGADAGVNPQAEPAGVSAETLAALLADGNDSAGGMAVSGRGVAVTAPDIASLSLGVSTLARTARQSRDEAAANMADLIASLQDNGIAEEDYHTTQFRIDPEIDYRSNGEQVIRGYRVTSMLAVKVRDLDRVGEVIDDAVDAVGDPVRVQGVTFSIDDFGALQSEARAVAMADAKTKAEELANLAGVELGKPVAIAESSPGGQPPIFFESFAAPAAADVSTPISPGQLEITVTVQVNYAID